MNIFFIDEQPEQAAKDLCLKHKPKMCVESAQMMASALLRHDAMPDSMPLTKSGTHYRGGYKHHPSTRWAGECVENYRWLARHALQQCLSYTETFGKVHACEQPIREMANHYAISNMPSNGDLTDIPLAMNEETTRHVPLTQAVQEYRDYYYRKTNVMAVEWPDNQIPTWWEDVCVRNGGIVI